MRDDRASIRRVLLVLSALPALAAGPAGAAAQAAVEVRGGAAIGNHTPAAAGLETVPGPSFGIAAHLGLTPWLDGYATYGRSDFGCEEGFCVDRGVTVATTAIGGGARIYPVPLLWVQGGVVRFGATIRSDTGEDEDPPHLGYEAGAGLRIPLGARLAFVPGFVYRAGFEAAGRTAVLVGEVGLRLRLR